MMRTPEEDQRNSDLSLLLVVVTHHPASHPSMMDCVSDVPRSTSARGRGRRRQLFVCPFRFPHYNLRSIRRRRPSLVFPLAPNLCGSRERSTSEETYRLWCSRQWQFQVRG